MRKLFIIVSALFFFSCKDENAIGTFTITGEIKNAPDQKIFLQELHFNRDSQIIDTAEIKNGKVTLKNTAPEEGLFILKLQNGSTYIFINDESKISFNIDASDQSIKSQTFNSPANASLKKFITGSDSLEESIKAANNNTLVLQGARASDSMMSLAQKNVSDKIGEYNSFLFHFIDTTSSPIIAMFAMGFTQHADAVAVSQEINKVANRFPNHRAFNELISQFHQSATQPKSNIAKPAEGVMAPDITMPDVNGKPFSLSSLRGKYVLVDFWASWCGPCRQENPNVVAAYKRFSNKNFTILGVSLDKEKSAWLKAIQDDGLTWNHISDLKFWNSEAVALYNFEGIPYNVLVDPQGKIIAKELRGEDLQNKLAEVLK